jgi:hypothetical protein
VNLNSLVNLPNLSKRAMTRRVPNTQDICELELTRRVPNTQVEECKFSGIRTARLWHSGSEHKSAVFGKNADDEESLAEGREDVVEQRTAAPHIQNVTIMSKRSGGVAVSPGGEGGGAARPGSWNIEAKGKSGGQAAGLDAIKSTGAGHSLSSDGAKVRRQVRFFHVEFNPIPCSRSL